MGFNIRLKNNQNALAATACTGVIGTTVAGNKVLMDGLQSGSGLCAEVALVIQTGSVTLTPSWQGSVDGTNWLSLVAMNSPANVAQSATATVGMMMQCAPLPFKYVRALVTVAGATATTGDTAAIKYHWVNGDV